MFIVDFDDTLFDTERYKSTRMSSLEKFGISRKMYRETYKEARNDSEGINVYTDGRHAQVLGARGFDKGAVLLELEKTTNEPAFFLFDDAWNFLELLKSYGDDMILLSLGNASHQEAKVNGAGIHDYFDRVFFVQDSKEHVIRKLFDAIDEENVWFINDKPKETVELYKKFPQMNCVLRKLPDHHEKEYEKTGSPFFHTLSEIGDYIKEKYEG